MLLFVLLLWLTACEEKASNNNTVPVENTTEVFTQKDKQKQSVQNTTIQSQSTGTFTLNSTQNISLKLMLSKKALSIDSKDVPLVLLNICSKTSSACITQISSLSQLQKKYKKHLFIVSVWDKYTKKSDINTYQQYKKANYFISHDTNSTDNDNFISTLFASLQIDQHTKLPLNVIYKKGKYYSHFEGPAPIEMLYHNIQQAIQK